MKCHESKRHLDLFMDGELSVPENLKVLEHLNLCRPCASVYEGETESPHFSAEDVERLADRLGDAAKRALDRLPPEHRLVFLLSTFEDLSYKEISAALAVPIGTVMSRLFRARAVLRRELADFARQEGYFHKDHENQENRSHEVS